MDEELIITREETAYDFGQGVVVSMSVERTRALTHDLGRLLQLLDDNVGCEEVEDAAAMDRLTDLVAALGKTVTP